MFLKWRKGMLKLCLVAYSFDVQNRVNCLSIVEAMLFFSFLVLIFIVKYFCTKSLVLKTQLMVIEERELLGQVHLLMVVGFFDPFEIDGSFGDTWGSSLVKCNWFDINMFVISRYLLVILIIIVIYYHYRYLTSTWSLFGIIIIFWNQLYHMRFLGAYSVSKT